MEKYGEFKVDYDNKMNVIGNFQIGAGNDSESVEIIKTGPYTALAEVRCNGRVHYEVYIFIPNKEYDIKSRDGYFRHGQNFIIKVISFEDATEAQVFYDMGMYINVHNPEEIFDYFRVSFDVKKLLHDHPDFPVHNLQFLI